MALAVEEGDALDDAPSGGAGGGGPLAHHTPIVVDEFGGLCTLYDKSDLPVGLAGYATNIEFFPGGFRSRSPFTLQMTDTYPYTGMLPWVTSDGVSKRMLLLSDGSLKCEYPEGTETSVATILGSSLAMSGIKLYGRVFMCFGDGKHGVHPPLQYNGTALRRISINGPGLALAAASSGTAGNVSTGYHYFAYAFLTDTGYLTRPSPWFELHVTAVSEKINISALTLGPAGTTARVIFATTAYVSATTQPENFYHLTSFIVPDNTTTTLTVDFTDTELLDSLEITGDTLYRRVVLPALLGCVQYAQRIVYFGGTNLIQEDPYNNTLVNFSFNGGFTAGIPNGWSSIVAGVSSSTPAGAVGATVRFTGDGATATQAKIESGVVSRSTPVASGLTTGTAYSVRVRLRRSSAFSTGGAQLTIAATGPTATLDIPVSSIGTTWAIYSGTLFTAAQTIDSSTRIQVGLTSAAAVTGSDYVELNDGVQIYPTDHPYAQDTLYISEILGEDDDESVDIITGQLDIAPGNGEDNRAAFVLRQNLYVGKMSAASGSLHTVQDVADFPNDWPQSVSDDTTGIPDPNAVATSEGVAAFISSAGAYIFDGGVPQKISTEIDGTWRAIDKTLLHKSWVVIDARLRRIFFAVPTTQSLIGKIMSMDFVEGLDNPISSPGHGRKWAEWQGLNNYAAGAMETRDDGSLVFLVAGNTNIANNYVANSTSFAFAPWTTDYTAWTVSSGQADPLGGTSATRWTAGAAGPNNAKLASSLSPGLGASYSAYLWIRTQSGTITDANVLDIDGSPNITTSWKRFALTTTGTAPVSIDLEFPTGTPDIYVFGAQVQLAAYNQGYIATSGSTLTGSNSSGVLARLVDLGTYEAFVDSNDFNAGLAPRYETAPLGPPIGRSEFNAVVVRITGNGSLAVSLVNQANTNDSLPAGSVTALPVKIMRDSRLTSAAKNDIEIMCNETETQLAVRFETENGIGQYSIKSFAIFARRSPYAFLRGHN